MPCSSNPSEASAVLALRVAESEHPRLLAASTRRKAGGASGKACGGRARGQPPASLAEAPLSPASLSEEGPWQLPTSALQQPTPPEEAGCRQPQPAGWSAEPASPRQAPAKFGRSRALEMAARARKAAASGEPEAALASLPHFPSLAADGGGEAEGGGGAGGGGEAPPEGGGAARVTLT
ncbi:unnamed protein product [Prorocentrum cordatum]|uniref:Uncharacterized protein n=1 Tax=Prorocentrum cordatum TaxID=2364126 RepID=A0ABN9Y368_9DINO|nr:unnamed protein product [Polarella glacialis]